MSLPIIAFSEFVCRKWNGLITGMGQPHSGASKAKASVLSMHDISNQALSY
jgi:hypothetical protein